MFQILISITFEQPAAMASSATSTQVEAQQPPATKTLRTTELHVVGLEPRPAFSRILSSTTRKDPTPKLGTELTIIQLAELNRVD
jgi:hypothetical protein